MAVAFAVAGLAQQPAPRCRYLSATGRLPMPTGMGAADITDRDVKAARNRLIDAASDPLAAHLARHHYSR